MQEDLLQFLWQYQYFAARDLRTTTGEPLVVLHPGRLNTHAGPDFSEARIRIGSTEWAGHVEIHVRAADWQRHGHHRDPAYDNVVLHVVYADGPPAHRHDGTPIPTLVLADRVSPEWLERHTHLTSGRTPIPCAPMFAEVDALYRAEMLDRALMQRLMQKAALVLLAWQNSGHDWEATAYLTLLPRLGFSVNNHAFAQLAHVLPWRLLQKHRHEPLAVEALLFGQAGWLTDDLADDYPLALRQTYRFLAHKYQLAPLDAAQWKFARMRPANFPPRRLAQWAAVLRQQPHLFAWLTETADLAELLSGWEAAPDAYWQTHYHFGKTSPAGPATMGRDAAASLVINAAVPLLAAVAQARGEHHYLDRAVAWLTQLPPETNRITRQWKAVGLAVRNAADAQGCLEWQASYCQPRRCLHCSVGAKWLRSAAKG